MILLFSDDWFNSGVVQTKNYIQDFQLVDQIKWDQAFKRNFNNNNDEQMSSKSYPNYAISAGGALFVNMITGGICNDSNFNILESFGNYNGGFKNDGTGTHGDKNACFGTGGKCLLLSCWYKEKKAQLVRFLIIILRMAIIMIAQSKKHPRQSLVILV